MHIRYSVMGTHFHQVRAPSAGDPAQPLEEAKYQVPSYSCLCMNPPRQRYRVFQQSSSKIKALCLQQTAVESVPSWDSAEKVTNIA